MKITTYIVLLISVPSATELMGRFRFLAYTGEREQNKQREKNNKTINNYNLLTKILNNYEKEFIFWNADMLGVCGM